MIRKFGIRDFASLIRDSYEVAPRNGTLPSTPHAIYAALIACYAQGTIARRSFPERNSKLKHSENFEWSRSAVLSLSKGAVQIRGPPIFRFPNLKVTISFSRLIWFGADLDFGW